MKKTADIVPIKKEKEKKQSFKVVDHIGVFDNYFTDEISDKYLKYFDTLNQSYKRNDLNLAQDKHYSFLAGAYNDELSLQYLGQDFQQKFWSEVYPLYCQKFPILNEFAKHRMYDLKLQKTEKGQGYHKWHCEMMGPEDRNRFMVISLYLNTVEKGGETEFLNQGLRVEPVKNRLVIFPATYTHVHRGNPPLSGTKYIITGWVEFGV